MFAAGAHKGCSATPVSLVMELTRGRSTGLDMGSWAELPAFGSPLRLASTSPGRRCG